MKKLILVLLAILMLSAVMMPVMADETSPVKSYESAVNGELLYTIDFSGKDGVLEFASLHEGVEEEVFLYTPSDDGKSVTVTGSGVNVNTGCHWYAMIPELTGDSTTVYTMVYKASVTGDTGLNNTVGVGGLFVGCQATQYLNYYSNYNTNGELNRRGVVQIGHAKIDQGEEPYTYMATLDKAYEIDEQGFMTIMMVFNSREFMFSAYVLADNATDYTKEDSWILVDRHGYVPSQDCMGFAMYTYRPTMINATISDVGIYKGMLFADAFAEEEPATEVTTDPTTEPTEEPTTEATEKPTTGKPSINNDTKEEEPKDNTGLIIGIAAGAAVLVAAIAAVVVVVIKKKK